MKAFLATLHGATINWYTNLAYEENATWAALRKAFEVEFKLLRDDNEVVAEIYNTHQGKNGCVRVYQRRLKELIGKLENKPANEPKKRCFIEGLNPSIRKKMKVVPPSTYKKACDTAMDIESKDKTSRSKKENSNASSEEESKEESKTIQALHKDMMRTMKEIKGKK